MIELLEVLGLLEKHDRTAKRSKLVDNFTWQPGPSGPPEPPGPPFYTILKSYCLDGGGGVLTSENGMISHKKNINDVGNFYMTCLDYSIFNMLRQKTGKLLLLNYSIE